LENAWIFETSNAKTTQAEAYATKDQESHCRSRRRNPFRSIEFILCGFLWKTQSKPQAKACLRQVDLRHEN
jgi:hypothetical protein